MAAGQQVSAEVFATDYQQISGKIVNTYIMNILVNMKLGDSKLEAKLLPMAQLDSVDKIAVVRDWPGPDLSKVEYHCPPRFISKLAVISALYKLFLLISLALLKKPDYIHSFRIFPHGILAFITAKLTRRPVGISLIAGPAELYSIGSQGVNYSQRLPWFGSIFRKILSNCDIVTVTGCFTRDFLIAQGINQERLHILHHTASQERYHPINVPKKYDVILVGNLIPLKHVEILLKAISLVKEKYPEVKAALLGDGSCRARLEELSKELSLRDNVEFLGFKSNVIHYYNSAKMLVLTSEREGFPAVFIEAMLCGIPAIVSNCGDIVDIAKNEFNSLVIEKYDDAAGFARAIIRLLEDEGLYRKLLQNTRVPGLLSIDNVAQEWHKILTSLDRKTINHE